MKKIILFILLLLPVASFAEETTDDMTTIYEEHFDGWLYFHTSGMNATYKSGNKDDVTIQTIPAYNAKSSLPCLRFAKQSSMDIVISNFTGAYGNFVLSFKKYNGDFSITYTYKDNATNKDKTKTLSANSDGTYTFKVQNNTNQITLTFTNGNSKVLLLDDIVVKAPTANIITSPSAELSFNQTVMSAYVGETHNSPTLSNPHDLPLKWYSSNQAIATVDESGNVTSHFIGTTTIYAIFEGNDNYAYQAVSYKLTTRREPLTNEVYYDGFANYIGTGGNGGNFENNAYVGNYTYSEGFTIDNTTGKYLSKGYQCLNVESVYTIKDLEKLGVKNGKLNFRCAPSSENTELTMTLNFSDNTTGEHVIAMQTNQWLDISVPLSSTSQLSSISFSGQKFFLDEISIISEDYVTIGSTGYATLYYSGRALKVPTGLKAYTMKVEDGKIVRSQTYSEGETLPKATAVVLKGDAGEYNLEASTEEGVTDNDNQLKGSDTQTSTTGNDGDKYYMLAKNDGEGVGFYWGAQNGAAFLNGEHKAYLAIPSTDINGSAAKSGYAFIEDDATAINKITDHESKSVSYTLDGMRCPQGFKGIVITNGRKTVKR